MKFIKNEKGIALVLVLILSLIGLAIVSVLLFMVTQETRMSGYHRLFRSADDAGLGGAGLAAEFIRKNAAMDPNLVRPNYSNMSCLTDKLSTSTKFWTHCVVNDMSFDPITSPDMTIALPGAFLGQVFTVSAKIVDTVKGNTQINGIVNTTELGGTPVVSDQGGVINKTPNPYLYRMEVQTQDNTNSTEKSRYSILYAN